MARFIVERTVDNISMEMLEQATRRSREVLTDMSGVPSATTAPDASHRALRRARCSGRAAPRPLVESAPGTLNKTSTGETLDSARHRWENLCSVLRQSAPY